MKKYLCLFLFVIAGCATSGVAQKQKITTTTAPDGTITKTTEYQYSVAGYDKAEVPPYEGDGDKQTSGEAKSSGLLDSMNASMSLLKPGIYIGGLLILVGVGLIAFTPMKYAGGVSIASGVGLIVVSYLLAQYSFIILLVALGAAGVLVYRMIYKTRVDNKALEETIQTAEVTKNKLDPVKKEELFGSGVGIVNQIQSSKTMQVVRDIRSKLKAAGKI